MALGLSFPVKVFFAHNWFRPRLCLARSDEPWLSDAIHEPDGRSLRTWSIGFSIVFPPAGAGVCPEIYISV